MGWGGSGGKAVNCKENVTKLEKGYSSSNTKLQKVFQNGDGFPKFPKITYIMAPKIID